MPGSLAMLLLSLSAAPPLEPASSSPWLVRLLPLGEDDACASGWPLAEPIPRVGEAGVNVGSRTSTLRPAIEQPPAAHAAGGLREWGLRRTAPQDEKRRFNRGRGSGSSTKQRTQGGGGRGDERERGGRGGRVLRDSQREGEGDREAERARERERETERGQIIDLPIDRDRSFGMPHAAQKRELFNVNAHATEFAVYFILGPIRDS